MNTSQLSVGTMSGSNHNHGHNQGHPTSHSTNHGAGHGGTTHLGGTPSGIGQSVHSGGGHTGVQADTGQKSAELHRFASELFRQQSDWIVFFRKVLGVDGVARRLFPSQHEMTAFEKTTEYADIQQMMAKLRQQSGGAPVDGTEPTRVITVRLPKSLHESLRTEAHEKRTSMNKLCISKLLQMVDEQLIPTD